MDPEMLNLAQAFVDGILTIADVDDRLSARREPIMSDVEADLWGVVFDIRDEGEDVEEGRRWLAEKYGLNRRSSESDSTNPS